MIEPTTPIIKDQLLSSADPTKVRAIYPRGSATLLAFDNSGQQVPNTPLTADGAFERATIDRNGNLLYCSDRPGSVPTLVVGSGLA